MDPKLYIEKLFEVKQMPVAPHQAALFEEFCSNASYLEAATDILRKQQLLMDAWSLNNRINDIKRQQVMIPNGTVGKVYGAQLDTTGWGWQDLVLLELEGLEAIGLAYDPETQQIRGIPEQNGDFKLKLKFKVTGEAEDAVPNEKLIPLIINPDPKSLWKTTPSDNTDPFWKADETAVSAPLGDRHIVAASKRGRSHANTGAFRDDDFAFAHFATSGWSVVAVSDGAGSAKFSRQGSRIACDTVVQYLGNKAEGGDFAELDTLLEAYNTNTGTDLQKKISLHIYQALGGAAQQAYKEIEAFAKEQGAGIRDFHATLIFALVKKYKSGYAVLTFGVGDCPIGLISKDRSAVHLMNKLDVGEFGGGTRFITMPEIFRDDLSGRFGFKFVEDFTALMLMTDGIYDPKFEVEANLEQVSKWDGFLRDLEGDNADLARVNLDADNPDIATELSVWMDFWSPGNHDDRTLVIIF
ncbi:PP2C family serine/threonine-protein phosphatase [Taibaiella chishuiensis]|uniref:Protein phosphatase 2C-like protein n=1 Tax=Taibaiella chishuiensis TaxID=1434707 RepID=A0A2P8D0C9_9BACT|nr:PP2C family serine/threonine-protein phosphatase [Taibaiella chishuiensis]PSK90674.1 protein phosphatase 2C-like protein [Taibaiella chishuiensis]